MKRTRASAFSSKALDEKAQKLEKAFNEGNLLNISIACSELSAEYGVLGNLKVNDKETARLRDYYRSLSCKFSNAHSVLYSSEAKLRQALNHDRFPDVEGACKEMVEKYRSIMTDDPNRGSQMIFWISRLYRDLIKIPYEGSEKFHRLRIYLCKEIVAMYEDELKANPKSAEIMKQLKHFYSDLSMSYNAQGDFDSATESKKKRIVIEERFIKEFGGGIHEKCDLVRSYQRLGHDYDIKGMWLEKLKSDESALDIAYSIYSPECYLFIKDLRTSVIRGVDEVLCKIGKEHKEYSDSVVKKIEAISPFMSFYKPFNNIVLSDNSEVLCVEYKDCNPSADVVRFPSAILIYSSCRGRDGISIKIHKNDLEIAPSLIESLYRENPRQDKCAPVTHEFFKRCEDVKNCNMKANLTTLQLMEVCLLAGIDVVGMRYNPDLLMSKAKAMMPMTSAAVLSGRCQGSYLRVLPIEVVAHILSFLKTQEVCKLGL